MSGNPQWSGRRMRHHVTLTESDAIGLRYYARALSGTLWAKAQQLHREGCWGVAVKTIYDVLTDQTWRGVTDGRASQS